jgi:hypothetical protein
MIRPYYWSIKVTHKPTGISATRTSGYFRSEKTAYDSAIKYIKSRVVMLGHNPMREDELSFETVESSN